jgi:hypothetical protein
MLRIIGESFSLECGLLEEVRPLVVRLPDRP